MAQYLVALGNKLTGARGIMGYLEVYGNAHTREPIAMDVYSASGCFPRSIAARAARFGVVSAASSRDLIDKYGPELD